MMNELTVKKYEEFMENGTILIGLVKLVQYNQELDTDILMLDLDGVKAIITRDEIDVREIKTSLVNFVGKKIKFMVKEIDRETGVVICSRKIVKELERDAMIKRLEAGEEVDAKIVKMLNFGAYLDIEGVTALIRNQDWAEDYTSINEVLKIGDTLKVKLRKVTANKRIFVDAIEKYKNPTIMSFEIFEPNQVVLGVVRNVKTWGAYVCIAPNIDALCPIPATTDIEENMKVSFRITQVRAEEGRVRGKIIKVLPNEIE
ncbi:TPA: 30S ribosomal protein S1 [Clostridium botulinum]|nr:30S ribosomal protein S1 [Clostridium botulinum]